jgi:hypothetical protein
VLELLVVDALLGVDELDSPEDELDDSLDDELLDELDVDELENSVLDAFTADFSAFRLSVR